MRIGPCTKVLIVIYCIHYKYKKIHTIVINIEINRYENVFFCSIQFLIVCYGLVVRCVFVRYICLTQSIVLRSGCVLYSPAQTLSASSCHFGQENRVPLIRNIDPPNETVRQLDSNPDRRR